MLFSWADVYIKMEGHLLPQEGSSASVLAAVAASDAEAWCSLW
jgi:hypothetical protein